MQDTQRHIWIGILLVVVGILFLLQNLGVFGEFGQAIWALLFAVGGLVFLWVFVSNREQWWAVIPGCTLLGIAALIGLGDRLGVLAGVFFLAAIGLSFWIIYLTRRDFWWAVIPGGTLFTLALVAGLSDTLPGLETGGVFFLGLAATFALLSLLRTPEGRMKWALIPAGALAIMGLGLMVATGNLINILWPVALILFGAYLLLRQFILRHE